MAAFDLALALIMAVFYLASSSDSITGSFTSVSVTTGATALASAILEIDLSFLASCFCFSAMFLA